MVFKWSFWTETLTVWLNVRGLNIGCGVWEGQFEWFFDDSSLKNEFCARNGIVKIVDNNCASIRMWLNEIKLIEPPSNDSHNEYFHASDEAITIHDRLVENSFGAVHSSASSKLCKKQTWETRVDHLLEVWSNHISIISIECVKRIKKRESLSKHSYMDHEGRAPKEIEK